jgi:hypothetical protein
MSQTLQSSSQSDVPFYMTTDILYDDGHLVVWSLGRNRMMPGVMMPGATIFGAS